MKKLSLIVALFLALSTIITRAQDPTRLLPRLTGFDVVEASIDDMQTAMRRGRVTSKELVLQSFARIAFYKDLLNPTISLFRDAVAQAEELDLERAQGRGLHRAGVQRAGVDRDGLRVRAGDEEAHSAAEHAVGRWSHA